MSQRRKSRTPRPMDVVGWREWVSLPELGISAVKAKIDTGARSSVLHAYDVELYDEGGVQRVRFKVHPFQKNYRYAVAASAELIERRWVRSSSGHRTFRPVIATEVALGERHFRVQLTLTNRDAMGFRMLLGRRSLRKRFLVDPNRSYVHGRDLEKYQEYYAPGRPGAGEEGQS